MATNDATIIATRLTSDELEKSINELVTKVESGINRMAKVVDNGVARMSDAFAKLGDGLKSTGGTRRTEQNNKEAESVKKLSETYDTMAQSIQKAVNLKPLSSRVESYGGMGGDKGENIRLGMIQRALNNIEIQKNAITAEIAKLETKISEKTDGKIEQLNQKIEQARQHIKGFQAEIAGLEFASKTTGVDNSQSIQVARNNIKRLEQEIAEYQERIKNAPDFFGKKEMAQIKELQQQLKQLTDRAKELEASKLTMPIKNDEPAIIKATTEALKAEGDAIEKNRQRWETDRQARIQSGLAAQEQSQRIINAMHFQAAKDTDTPILGIRELRNELVKMQQAWTLMSETEKRSPIGISLQRSIEAAKKAEIATAGYNQVLMRVSSAARDADPSIERLNNDLNSLRNELNSLSKSELFSTSGINLRSRFQEMANDVREMQRVLSRPVSLNAALGMDESSLDRIADKIHALRSYKQGLNLTDKNQVAEIKTIDENLDRLIRRQNELLGNNARLTSSNNALARSFNYMKNRLAFYFTVGASTQFIKTLIDVRSQYEMTERSLGILINSAERGSQIFNQLSDMALVSPFTLIELSNAAKQLVAYDVAAKDVVDTTRRLADMSAAVGIPMERLTYALGQIKAYGYLNARDARMFANAGIPLVRQLSEHYTQLEGRMVSVADVYDRIKKKAIDYNDVMQVINRMTDEGGKFFDFQAKMAGTLKVQLANLTLAWNNMLNEIGESEQSLISAPIKWLKELFLQWKSIDRVIKSLAWSFGIFKVLQLIALTISKSWGDEMARQVVLGKKLSNTYKGLGESAFSTSQIMRAGWAVAIFAVIDAIRTINQAKEAIHDLNKSIADGAKESKEALDSTLNSFKDMYELSSSNGKVTSVKYTGSQNIDEMQKAWDAIREEITNSSSAAATFIGRLDSIDNHAERLARAFHLAAELRDVKGILSDIDEEAIKVGQNYSAWWNLYTANEGLIDGFKKTKEELKEQSGFWSQLGDYITDTNNLLDAAAGYWGFAAKIIREFTQGTDATNESIKELAKSLSDLAGSKGLNAIQSREMFNMSLDKITEGKGLNSKDEFELRRKIEQEFIKERLADFDAAYKKQIEIGNNAEAQIILNSRKLWLERFGENETLTTTFYNWLKTHHASELQGLFGKMTQEEINHINWSEDKWQKWAKTNAEKFAQEYKISFDELWNLIKEASTWQVHIGFILDTTELRKSMFQQLSEWDTQANDAYTRIKRLKERSKDVLGQEDRMLLNKEIASEEKRYNEAIEKGGKSSAAAAEAKKAETAARKGAAAATRAQRQAESELQKALKEELSLIDKVRSTYKTLTKEGVDSQTALTESTSGYEKTVKSINKALGKFGITPLDLTKYAGVSNPREIMNMLQSQLDKLSKSGAVKPAEIKDLQVKLKDLKIDSITFDQKAITTSLNNELSKLKEEYELAVELDANPELGDMFADMFDIDTTEFPKSIDEYIWKVQDAFEKAVDDSDLDKKGRYFDVFTANAKDWSEWAERVGMSEEALKNFNSKFVEARDYAMKWARDTIKATQDLEYKLADTNGKIAIEEEKLANLKQRLAQETNEEQKRLLELLIKDQENTISRLKDEAVSTLSTYKNLFNSIVDHSARVTRKLATQWKGALENAVKNADGTYTITDPLSGETSTVSEDKYNKLLAQVNKKLRETQSSFAKIKEALKKSEGGLIDWEKAMELIADEAKKVSDVVKTIGNISETLGASENTVEIINDIADSIDGLATTAQGIAQMSTDPIGGTLNVVKGLWQSVSSWFDNSNKKIDKKVKESERNVARLEIAYKRLEHAVENSMGTAETQARRATIANKELQLTEKQRELDLEKSRKSKNQDQDKIIQLEGEIQDLEFEIENLAKGVADSLLGSDIKSAAEDFVDTWVSAWKEGEKTLDAMNEKVDEMIYNLVKKAATSAIVGKIIKPLYDAVDQYTSDASAGGAELTMSELKALSELASTLGVKIDTALGAFYNNLEAQNIISKGAASSNLSALQQGIQGITEDTAGALEAYMNIVSQQVFLHSDLLTQIRDAVVMMSGDVQLATQAQMLLQLQQSYSVQMAIQAILEGWTNANGMAVRVELMN